MQPMISLQRARRRHYMDQDDDDLSSLNSISRENSFEALEVENKKEGEEKERNDENAENHDDDDNDDAGISLEEMMSCIDQMHQTNNSQDEDDASISMLSEVPSISETCVPLENGDTSTMTILSYGSLDTSQSLHPNSIANRLRQEDSDSDDDRSEESDSVQSDWRNSPGLEDSASPRQYRSLQKWKDMAHFVASSPTIERGRKKGCMSGAAIVDRVLDFLKEHARPGTDISRSSATRLCQKLLRQGLMSYKKVRRSSHSIVSETEFVDNDCVFYKIHHKVDLEDLSVAALMS